MPPDGNCHAPILPAILAAVPFLRRITRLRIRDDQKQTRTERDAYRYFNAEAHMLLENVIEARKQAPEEILENLLLPVASSLEFAIKDAIQTYESYELAAPFPKLQTLMAIILQSSEESWRLAATFVDFGPSVAGFDLVDDLRECNVQLEIQFRGDIESGPSITVEKRFEPDYDLHNSVLAVYRILSSERQCTCALDESCRKHQKTVALGLATYREVKQTGHGCEFDVLFGSHPSQELWQDAKIKAVREERAIKKVVKFDLPTSDGDSEKVSKRNQMKREVLNLCNILEKGRQSRFLVELTMENNKLWHEKPKRFYKRLDQLIRKETTTLEKLLLSSSGALTDLTRRVVAVLLAYALMYLFDSPWLRDWSKADVFFIESDGVVSIRPYLSSKLDLQRKTEDEDDYYRQHPYPTILSLGILLLELHLGQTIEQFLQSRKNMDEEDKQKETDEDDDEENINSTFFKAEEVFQMRKSHLFDDYRMAVEACLDLNFAEDLEPGSLEFRQLIYNSIVKPLEDELEKGYKSWLSVETLDDTARKTDLGSIGQVIENKIPVANTSKSQFVSEFKLNAKFDKMSLKVDSGEIFSTQPKGPRQEKFETREFVIKHKTLSPDSPTTDNVFALFDDSNLSSDFSAEACRLSDGWFQKYNEKILPLVQDNAVKPPRIKIAILDTGIDMNHPDILAREERIQGVWNWVGGLQGESDRYCGDANGHGTHVTSLLLDIAPYADIFIGRITESGELSETAGVADAIRRATEDWEVDIINMSFGFPYRIAEIEDAIRAAYAKNIIIFAAASNDGKNNPRAFPAKQSEVICVHFTNANGRLSDYNPPLQIGENFSTLGEAVESAWPTKLGKSFTQRKSGTSIATPIAAGTAAFILEYARQKFPVSKTTKRLKTSDGIKEVFRLISGTPGPYDGYQYIAPWYFYQNSEAKIREDILKALR